ncbi:response regulator [Candidatus Nitrospira bockiana]
MLIIDDDSALLVALPQLLMNHLPDVIVDTCESPSGVLERLRQHDYHLVLCDIAMPGVDGFAVLDRIRGSSPDVPVLLLTGHVDDSLEDRARVHGASGLLRKPMDRVVLLDAIAGLLSKKVR